MNVAGPVFGVLATVGTRLCACRVGGSVASECASVLRVEEIMLRGGCFLPRGTTDTPEDGLRGGWHGSRARLARWGLLVLLVAPSHVASAIGNAEPDDPRAGNTSIPRWGYETCRCATATELKEKYEEKEEKHLNETFSALGLTWLDYGIECRNHDINTPECARPEPPPDCASLNPLPEDCEDEIPDHCHLKWCFILPDTNCTLRWGSKHPYNNELSAVFRNHTLQTSHSTCGDADPQERWNVEHNLDGVVIRVGYRSEEDGWKGVFHPNGNPEHGMFMEGSWSGPMEAMLQAVQKEAKFKINRTDAPDWVYKSTPKYEDYVDTYRECIYAVSLGYLHMCVGLYTVDEFSTGLTNVITVSHDSMYVVSKLSKASFLSRLLLVFEPFDHEVWATVVCLLIGSSVLVLAMELLHERQTVVDDETPLPERAGMFLLDGFAGFVSGGVGWTSNSWGGRVATVGVGFFILLTLSMYTANLTNILVSNSAVAKVSSIADAISQGVGLCVDHDNLMTGLGEHYSNVNWVELEPDVETGHDPVFTALAQNKCVAGVVLEEAFQEAQADSMGCDVELVGQPVYEVRRGIPITDGDPQHPGLAYSLRWYLQKYVNSGKLKKLLEANTPTPNCSSTVSSSNSNTFGMSDMLGPYFSLLFFMVLGASISAVSFAVNLLQKQRMVSPFSKVVTSQTEVSIVEELDK